MKKFKSLNSKLLIYFISFSIFIFAIIWFMQLIMMNTTYEFIRKNEIHNLYTSVSKNYNSSNLNSINEAAFKNDSVVYILDNNLNKIYSTDEILGNIPRTVTSSITEALNELKTKDIIDTNFSVNKFNNTVNVYAEKADDYYIVILSTLDPMDSTVKVLTIQLAYITVLSIFIAIIVSFIVSKKLSLPIRNITDKAKELEKGNFEVEFSKGNYLEIDELSETLNKTAAKLSEIDKLRKEVIANVSHDLKTPLAMIKAYSEMLQDISGDEKIKRDKHLKVIGKEVDNLSLLVTDMLDLSKLESGSSTLNITEFDIISNIRSVIDRFTQVTENNGINIEFNTDVTECVVKLDKLKISQVLYNLIGNAIAFVGEDKKVFVNFKSISNNKYLIEIKDNGKGIKEENLNNIFERYYTTNDKYRKFGVSTGLGLSIVKNILEKLQLKYGVISKENVGTTFWFEV